MDLKRFFTDRIIGDTAVLYGAEFIHAVKVVRLKIGYKLIVCDNTGFDYYCEVQSIGKDSLAAKIEKRVANDTELSYNVILYIGNNKDLDTVIQKAVELGVKKVIPFTSQHCNVSTVNYERLNKIIIESSKQCGRATLMEVGDLVPFDSIEPDNSEIYAFYEYERDKKISSLPIPEPNKNICIIIGCEGGFSVEERQLMDKKGFNVLTLGKRILRVSTAVVSAITIVNDHLGEI